MHLHIDPHTDQPIYRQIESQIARAIAERRLRPGDPLLPEQELATRLVVSPAAVHRAYLELEASGLCHGATGSLYRVVDPGLDRTGRGHTQMALSWFEREQLTREIEAARRIQRRLLPPEEVRREAYTVASRCYPAGTLAGDFYELIESRAEGIVDLIIADVAGKGLAAGLIMAATKSLLSLVADAATPGAALTALNARLHGILGPRQFVAMAWARLNIDSGGLEVANAGLPDPARIAADGRIEWIEATSTRLPLGARYGSRYSTRRLALGRNDRLLLLTDGLPESIDVSGRTLGYENLQRVLEEILDRRAENGDDAGAWLDRLLDEIGRRTGLLRTDDWTAMVLAYHPRAEESPCSS